jgi:hypothetical protein
LTAISTPVAHVDSVAAAPRSSISSSTKPGDIQDPAGFLTAVPNWTVGETFLMAHGRKFRILEIGTELLPEMLDAGFNGIFVVGPA